MSPAEPGSYRLVPKPLEDLDEVWRYMAEMWWHAQADTTIDDLMRIFEAIATPTTLGRERLEFTKPARIKMMPAPIILEMPTNVAN